MPLVQDKGKMRISHKAQVRATLFKKTVLKTTSKNNTTLPILLSLQVVSAMSTDAEFLGNEKY